MKTYFNPRHTLHAPKHEYFRGQLVPCFEKPDRLQHIEVALRAAGHPLVTDFDDSTAVLAQVHSADYLAFLQGAWDEWVALDAANSAVQPFPSTWVIRSLRRDVVPHNFSARLGLYSMDNGTPLDVGTWAAAKAGADAAYTAAKALAAGQDRALFCCTRPPGHHAGADFMGGYCFLNNAAVAAQTLRNSGAAKVAILDVDYHHGNGTQAIFEARRDVLFASIHGDPRTEYPFFLGHADEVGTGDGLGYTLNLPLPAGSDAATWFAALDKALARIAAEQVDALVVSLGLDTFIDDPISHFKLHTADFLILGAKLASLNLPTLLVMEGGYASPELGTNVQQVLLGMQGG